MRITRHEDPINNETVFTLHVSRRDKVLALDRMTGHDRLLLIECENSKKVSDILLGLELYARKYEEGYAAERARLDKRPKI